MKLNPLIVLSPLAALACEPGQQSTPFLHTETADSAGIQVVEKRTTAGWLAAPLAHRAGANRLDESSERPQRPHTILRR